MEDVYSLFLERYSSFTEIQKLSIPVIEKGSNCIIVAPTGSGKTEAAVLPLIKSLKEKDNSPIKILYITPLRALNRDMLRRLEEICKYSNITIGVRHGDTSQKERNKQVRSAPMLLITTPETLQSILPTKYIGPYLKNLSAVVIDELHELYSNKRGSQLSIALERLEELSPNFQRIGISATIGDPETARNFLCNERPCEIVKVDSIKEMHLSVEAPSRAKADLSAIEEKFGLDGPSLARLELISDLVADSKSSIIFANTRQVVESLGSRLLYLNKVHPFGGIGVHHSSLDKQERINIENMFKSGEIKSIIATSSLELGIDIGSIDLVVQYGSPRQALRLAQRVGRSGHTHKGISKGVVIASNPVEVMETFAIFGLVRAGTFETFKPQFGALDVLANQICGVALDKGKIELESLHKMLKRSYVYKDTQLATLTRLLEFMVGLRLVGFDGNFITSGSRTRMYYYGHLSVIPDSKRFLVKNAMENRIISTLDEKFVANNVDDDSVFITKGLPWKVLSIDKNVISVEPSTNLEAAVPDWTGEDIPVSYKTAMGVFGLLGSSPEPTKKDVGIDALKSIKDLKEKQQQSFVPSENLLIIESLEEFCIIYTGLGTQANEALSRLLAHIVSIRIGRSVNVRASPYMVMLEVGRDFDIVGALEGITDENAEAALKSALAETELFRYRFITIAKLFGVIEREAVVSKSFAKRIIRVMNDTPIHEEAFRELMENYFGIATLKDFFRKLNRKTIKINLIKRDKPSILTKTILNSAYYTKELITPLTPNSELVESFSRFILSKVVNLLCTYCGFRFSRKLNEIKGADKIVCPNCGSPMITFYDDEYNKVIIKRIESKKLNSKEKNILKEMLQYASLIESYGPKAATALSVYGVGPKTAARALMMLRHDEKDFFMDLIEAQKNFIRTKKYWSV
jgi:ATP-dependent helicase Lhr and Lhr-like helicase